MNRQITPSERASLDPSEVPSERRGSGGRRRFRAAQRHSRWVRFFRVFMPLAVVVVLAGAVGFAYFNPFRVVPDLPVELGRASLNGSQIKMEFPKLSGFTADDRGYSLTAQSAAQDLASPNRIDLDQINARLELADNGWATLKAADGSYDTKSQMITLGGGVVVDTNSGYGGKLQDASISMQEGRLVTEKPVELTYLDGRLTADRMEVTQKDSRALFNGNVRLLFKMPPPSGEKGPPELRPGEAKAGATQ